MTRAKNESLAKLIDLEYEKLSHIDRFTHATDFQKLQSNLFSHRKCGVLQLAGETENIELINFVLDSGVDPDSINEKGDSLLHTIATSTFQSFEQFKSVFNVLKKHKFDKHKRNLDKNNAFMCSFSQNLKHKAKFFLEEGLDINC
mmetsp:Transcript_38778/g.28670  ORF Transcript_38778/g.28670 Transcript_38778/m.28670 type:complete len:145 (+) Transcript_38778:747-1181(+)